jgi:hypothetical protein
MATKTLTPDELRRRGYEALVKELGPDGFVRFLQYLREGHGDYTAERRARLDADPETLDRILDEINQKQHS